jgi:DnaJ-class molecular chaperone
VELPPLGKRGLAKIRVPPNTLAGTGFRLLGKGIPSLSDPVSKGHLFVTVETDDGPLN